MSSLSNRNADNTKSVTTGFFLLKNPVIYLDYLINKALYIFYVLYKY